MRVHTTPISVFEMPNVSITNCNSLQSTTKGMQTVFEERQARNAGHTKETRKMVENEYMSDIPTTYPWMVIN